MNIKQDRSLNIGTINEGMILDLTNGDDVISGTDTNILYQSEDKTSWYFSSDYTWGGINVSTNRTFLEIGKIYYLSFILLDKRGDLQRIGGHLGTTSNSYNFTVNGDITNQRYSDSYLINDDNRPEDNLYSVNLLIDFQGDYTQIQPNRGGTSFFEVEIYDLKIIEVDSTDFKKDIVLQNNKLTVTEINEVGYTDGMILNLNSKDGFVDRSDTNKVVSNVGNVSISDNGYEFNGTDLKYISCPSTSGFFPLENFTFSSDFNCKGVGTNYGGIACLTFGLAAYIGSNGSFNFRIFTNIENHLHKFIVDSNYNYIDGKNHNFIVTMKDQVLKLYIDGIFKSQISVPEWFGDTLYTNTMNVGIDNNDSNTTRFNGTIDNVKIFNRTLSEYEIGIESKKHNSITQQVSGELQVNEINNVGITDGLYSYWSCLDSSNSQGELGEDIILSSGTVITNSGLDSNNSTYRNYLSGTKDIGILSYGTESGYQGSMSCCFKASVNHLGDYCGIFFKHGYHSGIVLINNIPSFRLYNDTLRTISSQEQILIDKWYYAVVTVDDGNYTFYLNGVNLGSFYAPSSFSHQVLDFDVCSGDSPTRFKGIIKQIKLFDRVLSEEEILSEYKTFV